LKFSRKLAIFFRLLLIQSAFTDKLMQNRGFLWALLPATNKLTAEELTEFMTNQNRFFNSHPWMTGWAAGLQLNALRCGEDATALKESLISPLGAIGDRLFWHQLKPVSALPAAIGIVGGLCGFPYAFQTGLFISVLLLILPNLAMRWHGLSHSLAHGRVCLKGLLALRDTSVFKQLQILGALLLGVWLAWLAAWQQGTDFRQLILLVGSAFFYALLSKLSSSLILRLLITLTTAGILVALNPSWL
jgi:mannose/fructose/N-acetylgalactosamine-specific phosphotransferase system component IID